MWYQAMYYISLVQYNTNFDQTYNLNKTSGYLYKIILNDSLNILLIVYWELPRIECIIYHVRYLMTYFRIKKTYLE